MEGHEPAAHQLVECAAGEDKSGYQLSDLHQGECLCFLWWGMQCAGGCQHRHYSCTAMLPAHGAALYIKRAEASFMPGLTLIAILSASSRLPSMLSTSASMHSTQHVRPDRMQSALRSRGLPAVRPLEHKLAELPASCTDALCEHKLQELICALKGRRSKLAAVLPLA